MVDPKAKGSFLPNVQRFYLVMSLDAYDFSATCFIQLAVIPLT
jgi:hypothetical protein